MHVALAEKQHQQVIAARAKALANKANECHCLKAAALAEMVLAEEQCHRNLEERAAALAERSLADEQYPALLTWDALLVLLTTLWQNMVSLDLLAAALADSVTLTDMALAEEQCFFAVTEHTAVLAERSLANEHCCREEAECSATLVGMALAKEQHCYAAAEQAVMLADLALANDL